MQAAAVRIVAAGIVVLLAACSGAPPTPPPAEPHTAFEPAEVKVASDPDWLSVAFGSVWVKRPEGFVDRIDAPTATITAEIQVHETRSDACEGIGAGAATIWSCDGHDLVAIDPARDDVVETIPTGKVPGQGRLVSAAGRIWVLSGEGDRLVGVAERDGSLSQPIVLPVACHDLGAAGDIVYVVCERGDRVLRVDPASATVTATATITRPTWVSAAASGIWVSTEHALSRLDPETLSTTLTLEGVGAGAMGSIAADPGGVWVRTISPFLTRVDASSRSISRVISAPFQSGGDVVVDGDHVWATVIDDRLVIRLHVPVEG